MNSSLLGLEISLSYSLLMCRTITSSFNTGSKEDQSCENVSCCIVVETLQGKKTTQHYLTVPSFPLRLNYTFQPCWEDIRLLCTHLSQFLVFLIILLLSKTLGYHYFFLGGIYSCKTKMKLIQSMKKGEAQV